MCFKWLDKNVKKLKGSDVPLFKVSVAAFALMVAKLWAPLLGLEWYWYAVIGVVASIIPMKRLFGR